MWSLPRQRSTDCSGSEASGEAEIVVNIGGLRQVLSEDVLSRYPDSRLAELASLAAANAEDLSELCDDYGGGEFYFDRDPDAFKCIMEVYYYGEIHMKRGICPACFMDEMEFWGVEPEYLDECCRSNLRDVEEELAEIAEKVQSLLEARERVRAVGAGSWKRFQARLWRLMEQPDSSVAARVIALTSFLLILISSAALCAGTIPELQTRDAHGNPAEPPALVTIDTACIAWFTIEYLLRLLAAPRKLRFLLSFLNIIDCLAILPYFLLLTLTQLGSALLELADVQQAVQAVRILRVARVLKLARHSSGLQTLTFALRSSCGELALLLMYMGVGIFLFSALAYTLEQSHPETMFTSIPQACWWAIITMTTVGYGDVYPKTTLGRCNAAVSFLCGVIAIALPIHPIINNFVVVYSKQRVLETAAQHEIQLMELRSQEAEEHTHTRAGARRRHTHTHAHTHTHTMCTAFSDTQIPLLEEPSQSTLSHTP
ncbi:potassium voltage-gated channel subfamily F member 1-like [Alosa sapidissima]|uniref:potassium voltage-gated channel subfamily F member 1-like n=1 Tax=Alosa sapidissima TaxID=34773 RepID=UPI001C0894B9|nr:potassium voltage-gated channel subfamily F member 1-like [Alosa sapidissima]